MNYLDIFENLSPHALNDLEEVVSPHVRFKDPFNDVIGLHALRAILEKTLDEVHNPKFTILDQARSDTCHYVRWEFTGSVKALGAIAFSGMSEIRYDESNRVCEHIDHWDASEQFYAKLPLLGWLLGFVKKRLQVS